MSVIVHKYGGSSLRSLEHIDAVTEKIIAARRTGANIAVVVSAMGDETDRLMSMATTLSKDPSPREIDVLLSTGEQVTIALLSIALEKRGYSARSFTGAQVHIRTDNAHNKARILDIEVARVRAALARGDIAVIAGFQGIDVDGNITTLGRGGSDTTAVAMAAVLEAKECLIHTDVEGVYTADPRIVPQARKLSHVTYEEMLELSSLGSRVLQIRAVEFARKFNVRMRVLSSFAEDPGGTLITDEEHTVEQALIAGIAHSADEAKLTLLGVPDRPGIAGQILQPIADENIEVDMIVQNVGENNTTDFTFTVGCADLGKAERILRKKSIELGAREVIADDNIVKISVVGVGMRSHAGIACRMFQALADEGINIRMISTSEIKISVVVDAKYLELGVRTLHATFGLEEQGTAVQ